MGGRIHTSAHPYLHTRTEDVLGEIEYTRVRIAQAKTEARCRANTSVGTARL